MIFVVAGCDNRIRMTYTAKWVCGMAVPEILEHSESADLLRKPLLPHVWRGEGEALLCKHERLFILISNIIA